MSPASHSHWFAAYCSSYLKMHPVVYSSSPPPFTMLIYFILSSQHILESYNYSPSSYCSYSLKMHPVVCSSCPPHFTVLIYFILSSQHILETYVYSPSPPTVSPLSESILFVLYIHSSSLHSKVYLFICTIRPCMLVPIIPVNIHPSLVLISLIQLHHNDRLWILLSV